MIPQQLKSNDINASWWRLIREPYLAINIIFAGIIILVMAYSGIFSPVKNNYPVICIHEKLTGEPCASCGLSHSFSLILRGQIDEAETWNRYGLRVFIFFAAQLLMRVVYSLYYIRYAQHRKYLIIADASGSALMFLIAFWPFIRWMILMTGNQAVS